MENVMNFAHWVQANIGLLIQGVLMIIGGASIIAKLTPTPEDDKIFDNVLRFVNKLALNKKPEA